MVKRCRYLNNNLLRFEWRKNHGITPSIDVSETTHLYDLASLTKTNENSPKLKHICVK